MPNSRILPTLYVLTASALLTGCSGVSGNAPLAASGPSAQTHASAPSANFATLAAAGPQTLTRPTAGDGSLRLPAWMRFAPGGTKKTVYVSRFNFSDVNEYKQANKKNAAPLCSITDQPYVNGIAVDDSGNLWVPTGGDFSGALNEFAPNCGALLFNLQDTNGQASGVAFDAAHNVYLLNIMDAGGNGNIDIFAPGATQPTSVLADSTAFRFFDLVLDASKNVYVSWADVYNKGHIDEFAAAAGPAIHLPFQYGFPGGVELDKKGNLLVTDNDALQIDVLAPPYTSDPIATFKIKSASVPCRFTRSGRELYCSDYGVGSVDVYKYNPSSPNATTYEYSFNNEIGRSSNAGIALSPGD